MGGAMNILLVRGVRLGAAMTLLALALLAGGCEMAADGEESEWEEYEHGGSRTSAVSLGRTGYDQYCAGCHGPDPGANTLNVGNGNGAEAIAEAIGRNAGGMGSLAFLSRSRLDAIAAYIRVAVSGAGASGSATAALGGALYADMCAGCHGSDPASGRNRISRGTSGAAITRVHNFVSTADADAIAGYIACRLSGGTGTACTGGTATTGPGTGGGGTGSTGGAPAQPARTLIPWDAEWAYRDDGVHPGADWMQPAHDDGAWPRGAAELGYGDGDEATVLGYGPDPWNRYITYYFRRAITVADPSAVPGLTARLKYDDGAVLYLNGQEVRRFNMPQGAIGQDTLAVTSHEAIDEFEIPASMLRQGANLFAVEIHQSIANSFDISFAFNLETTGTVPTAGAGAAADPAAGRTLYQAQCRGCHGADPAAGALRVNRGVSAGVITAMHGFVAPADATHIAAYIDGVVNGAVLPKASAGGLALPIPWGAEWAYLDDGADPGTAWRAVTFDDSAWPRGRAELGYGDGDEATVIRHGPDATSKHIAYHFRRAFTVADPAAIAGLVMDIKYDDGAVVYLNGTEVERHNMPAGTVGYLTLPNGTADAITRDMIDASLLVRGVNVIAVAVHQASPDSADVSFDLTLREATPSR